MAKKIKQTIKPSATKKVAAKTTNIPLKTTNLTAKDFILRVKALQSDEELKKIMRYFKSGEGQYGEGDKFIGVRMGHVFNLAKEFVDMPVGEIEKLLENPIHEVRAGGMSIMGKQATLKKTTEAQLKVLYDLYIRRHDRINNWDLVDLAAYYVVGHYLADKPKAILYKLAQSKNIWERRTAIVSTAHFILKQKQVDDTFKIAEMLLKDEEDLIHKATGWMVRAAGQTDRNKLLVFLDKYAATMPRTLLRNCLERLDKKQKDYYMSLAKK